MDPLAVTAATLVAKWATEGLVKEAAKSTWAALQKVYDAVRSRFATEEQAIVVLHALETDPKSEDRIAQLAELIDARLKIDHVFGNELRDLIDEASRDHIAASFVTQVMDNAQVGKVANITTVHGNVTF